MSFKDPEKARAYNREHMRAYRKKHPDRVSATAKRSRDKHKESIRVYQAWYSREHKEQIKRKNRRLYLANYEKQRADQARYYRENRDAITQRHAAYRATHTEEKRLYNRLYHQMFRERLLEQARQYRLMFPAEIAQRNKIWRMNNSHIIRVLNANRRARKRQLPNSFTQEQWKFMRQYWTYACAVCGREEGLWHVLADDHWIALSDSSCPGTVAWNLIPLCHGIGGCNNSKTGKNAYEWLIGRFGPRKAAKIEKAIAAYFALVRERFGEGAQEAVAD